MSSEKIYDALTDIREEYIDEASGHKLRKSRKAVVRWCAIAASLVFVVGIGSYMLANIGSLPTLGGSAVGRGSGRANPMDGSTVFMSYAGPVFPLSVLGDASGMTAVRDIAFDFSGFGESRTTGDGVMLRHSDVRVSDAYILANDTATDKTLQLLYPFAGSFADLHRLLPKVTLDGGMLETELIAGVYSGGFIGFDGHEDWAINLWPINSWDDYVSLLADGRYLQRALGDAPVLDQVVIVYEFANVRADHTQGVAPTLAATFDIDFGRTTVMTYMFNGASIDIESGFMRRSFFVPREGSRYDRSYYMIVAGDDVSNMTVQGFKNGGCHAGEEMDVTADVTRYEAVLGDILALLLYDYLLDDWVIETGDYREAIDMAMLYKAAVELLSDYGLLYENAIFRYGIGELTDIFMETLIMDRVFYLAAEIVIPAGESVSLSVDMIKAGSFDFYGSGSGNVGIYGYDLMTRLGSNLMFLSQSAGLRGAESIEIVKQNFGFDPANNVLRVTLDPDEPRYFLEVRNVMLGR